MIHLRPKSFALLRYLVEHSGLLVTKKELMNTLWPDSHVCDTALKHCVSEIRKALGDNTNAVRFIGTAHGRRYRFIGGVDDLQTMNRKRWISSKKQVLEPTIGDLQRVGRELELALLQGWLGKALGGERQVVFVTGEQGIGKTTLVDMFLDILDRGLPTEFQPLNSQSGTLESRAYVAWGQCLKFYGARESYMPFLEAFTRLCHEPIGTRVMAELNRYAPLWVIQMPSLVSADKLETLQRITLGATPARMLREMAEVIEVLCADVPLVLVLEDLHWSDYPTLDLISYLAKQRAPARLLLVATFRPEEVMGDEHPLMAIKQELQTHRLCQELPLAPLDEAAVREYLIRRFHGREPPVEVESWIQRRTDGNPLFMVNLVDYLIAQGLITQQGGRCILSAPLEEVEPEVPATIRQIIKR